MDDIFEVRHSDLGARIGRLYTAHGVVETPAFVPVVHPVKQSVSTRHLKEMGFRCVITNAYITMQRYGDEARRRGIHDIIGFDGAVMTDSGGYQVLEYGSVDVGPEAMATFERDIKSDIPIPLDKPTGYGLDYETAKKYVEITLKNSRETLDSASGPAIWVGPVQGAEHSDLVEYSARSLEEMGFKFLAIGSPVELMEAYEFLTLARMIAVTKKTVSPARPVHLFGAGHPLTIPLAVALGCDTFDSASYMLYAREGRYMHPNGTARLDDLSYLPCSCAICSATTPKELRSADQEQQTLQLAKHNLYVLKAEVDAVKQAIIDGRLWEYVMQKARAHPRLYEAMKLFAELDYIEDGTPQFKDKAIFLFDPLDQYRPEVRRYRRMVESRFRSESDTLVICPEGDVHPLYATRQYADLRAEFPDAQIISYSPYLGMMPAEISDIYPAAHHVSARSHVRPIDFDAFHESLRLFFQNNSFNEIIVFHADDFIRHALEQAGTKARITFR